MKAIKFCLVVFCLTLFGFNQTNAQSKTDSESYEKALKTKLVVLKNIKLLNVDQDYKPMVDIKLLDIAAKQVVRLKTPLVLQRGDDCVKIGCKEAPGGDCVTDCNLMWKDLNKDGRIQPRKELRCVCKNNGKCGIVARKTKCK